SFKTIAAVEDARKQRGSRAGSRFPRLKSRRRRTRWRARERLGAGWSAGRCHSEDRQPETPPGGDLLMSGGRLRRHPGHIRGVLGVRPERPRAVVGPSRLERVELYVRGPLDNRRDGPGGLRLRFLDCVEREEPRVFAKAARILNRAKWPLSDRVRKALEKWAR